MHRHSSIRTFFLAVPFLVFAGCQQQAANSAAEPAAKPGPPFKVTAGIKDIMAFEVDPAADGLWESVSVTQTKKGLERKHPKTDEEWWEQKRNAITLMEASNLLMMEGRKVAAEGVHLEDVGTSGNLTAEESQKAIDSNRETFLSFAQALHDVGEEMVKAVDAKNPKGIMDAGATLDNVCEGCHLKFWYPGQKIPLFPQQAPEEDSPNAEKNLAEAEKN